jgi:hypothetical protein
MMVADWAANSPVSHEELEVYRHAEGDYISLVEFLGSRKTTEDKVNHPKHYTAYKGIEVIQLTEQMNFNRGNTIKYVARAGLKDPETEIEDLEKALWYLRREIHRVKNK